MRAVTLSADVASRPTIRAPKFGKWLKALRGDERSLEAVASRVRDRLAEAGVDVKFHRSQLRKIEESGAIPPVVVLYELARIYRTTTGELLDLIAGELGLARPSPVAPIQHGAEHVISAARIRELEQRVEAYEQTATDLQAVTTRLVDIAARSKENRAPARRAPVRRRCH